MAQWVEAEALVWPWSQSKLLVWGFRQALLLGPLLFVCSLGCQCEGGRFPVISIMLELEIQGGAGLEGGAKKP